MDEIIEDVRRGKIVGIIDQSDRENELDIFIAAEKCDEYNISFGLNHASGLQCICMMPDRIKQLGIPPVPNNGRDAFSTGFFSAIDGTSQHGVTTGVSAADRVRTIKVVLNPNSTEEDFHFPGHMQILQGKQGLTDERFGHTENGLVLCLLANMQPISLIQEVIKPNGQMLKDSKEIEHFSKMYDIKIISTQEIKEAWDLKRKNGSR